MPRIFISYRRTDSRKDAARIYDRLVNEFGKDNVFKDVDSIPFGADFRKVISDEVNKCDAVLVIVGPQWLDSRDEYDNRRLDDPGDFVRIEIETGLKRDGTIVVPVLVDGASMPKAGNLPDSVRELAFKNAAAVRDDPDFHTDMTRLVNGLIQWFYAPPQVDHAQSIDDILPSPFEWCDIPPGTVLLEDASGYGGSSGGTFEVGPFLIAKYPITNAQYQVFVEALDGYRDSRWWDYSKEAQGWRAERSQPKNTAFAGTDFPRTNISWYDSAAFCHWLSNRTAQSIMLPNEQQWQRAAQGDDNREYPWGNAFESTRCNYGGKVGQTSPVTQYPTGRSPYGVMDMTGNVWEWCLTEWGTDSAALVGKGKRCLRGGSWEDFSLRAVYREAALPSAENGFYGFRCACAK
jgi:formylglycine-generating enzyme required for sulfatase activity